MWITVCRECGRVLAVGEGSPGEGLICPKHAQGGAVASSVPRAPYSPKVVGWLDAHVGANGAELIAAFIEPERAEEPVLAEEYLAAADDLLSPLFLGLPPSHEAPVVESPPSEAIAEEDACDHAENLKATERAEEAICDATLADAVSAPEEAPVDPVRDDPAAVTEEAPAEPLAAPQEARAGHGETRRRKNSRNRR